MADGIKTIRMDGKIVISGEDRAAVEAAAGELTAQGARMLSKVEQMGRRWAVTCQDPQDRSSECQIIKLGLQLMVKGPTRDCVQQKVTELVSSGARLVAAPAEAGSGWVAVCDDVDQIRKW